MATPFDLSVSIFGIMVLQRLRTPALSICNVSFRTTFVYCLFYVGRYSFVCIFSVMNSEQCPKILFQSEKLFLKIGDESGKLISFGCHFPPKTGKFWDIGFEQT